MERIHIVLTVKQTLHGTNKLGIVVEANALFNKEITHGIYPQLFISFKLLIYQHSEFFNQSDLLIEIKDIVFQSCHILRYWSDKCIDSSLLCQHLSLLKKIFCIAIFVADRNATIAKHIGKS